MSLKSVFVDTSGWANLFVATESYHNQAKQWLIDSRQQNQNLVTSNYIITELIALLNSPLKVPRPQLFQYIDAIMTAPYLTLIHVDPDIHQEAWQLLKNRDDKNWSLVDATSFIIMKNLRIEIALTTDHHFEQAGFRKILNNK